MNRGISNRVKIEKLMVEVRLEKRTLRTEILAEGLAIPDREIRRFIKRRKGITMKIFFSTHPETSQRKEKST